MGRSLSLETSAGTIPIRRRFVPADEVALYWLGQAGFLIEFRGIRVLVDPYLSDTLHDKYGGTIFPHTRMMAPPVDPQKLSDIDFVLVTHGHTDHFDPGTLPSIARANPTCRFVVPSSCRKGAEAMGLSGPATLLVNSYANIDLHDDLVLETLPSAHESRELDKEGNDRFLGYVMRLGELAVYHSGDTVPYAGLTNTLRSHSIDLMLLPINGRDENRRLNGAPGNCTFEEAVEIVEDSGANFLVGHHFGMFAFNTIDPVEASSWLRRNRPETFRRFFLAELRRRFVVS